MSNTQTVSHRQRPNLMVKCATLASFGFIVYSIYHKHSSRYRSDNNVKLLDTSPSKSNVHAQWSHEVLDNEAEQSATDLNVLIHSTDHFNGVRINSNKLPTNPQAFQRRLSYSLQRWRHDGKRGIFLKIGIDLVSTHLSIALSAGFVIHHGRPEYVMLTQWLPKNEMNMIPDYCHTYMATGNLIVNRRKQAVVIKEIWNHGRKDHWKLPGGAIDRCENMFDAAIRETKEETGLDCRFMGILQFRHFHPFRFGNSGDIYFICLLKYEGDIDEVEFDVDQNEIDEIKWMEVDQVLELKGQQPTFGGAECKANIKRNVDLLVKHWDDDIDGKDAGLKLSTFRPVQSKGDREWYVYAPKMM